MATPPGLTDVPQGTTVHHQLFFEELMEMFDSITTSPNDHTATVANYSNQPNFTATDRCLLYSYLPECISPSVRAFFVALYTIIIIMSLVGNLIVCVVVVARNNKVRSDQRVTNFFLANQALSDVAMTIFNIPFNVYFQLTGNWPFGQIMCHLVYYMGVTSVYVSTFTLTAIALDRHRLIVQPTRQRITMNVAKIIAVLIWTLALSLSVPFVISRRVEKQRREVCLENFHPDENTFFARYLALATFIGQYIIPLSLISMAYLRIGMKVWTKVGRVSTQKRAAHRRSKRRVIRKLVIFVAVFAVCWFPINLYIVLSSFRPEQHRSQLLFLLLHLLAMCSVCINPVAFAFLNKNFNSELMATCHRWYRNSDRCRSAQSQRCCMTTKIEPWQTGEET